MLSRSRTFVKSRLLRNDDNALQQRGLSEQIAISDELRTKVSALEERLAAQVQESTTLQHDQTLLLDELGALRPLRGKVDEQEALLEVRRLEVSKLQEDLASARTLAAVQVRELEPLRPLPQLLLQRGEEINELSNGVREREQHIAEQHAELKRLEDELDNIHAVSGRQSATIIALTHEVDQLRPLPALNEDLRQCLARHEATLQGLTNELDGSRECIRQLEDEHRVSLDQAAQRQQELQNVVTARDSIIDQLRDDASRLERAVQTQLENVRLRDDELSEYRRRYDCTCDELNVSRALAQEQESELSQLRPLMELLRARDLVVAELRRSISEHEQYGLEQTARVQHLELERDEALARLEAENRRHDELANRDVAVIKQLRDEGAAAETEMSALRTRCAQQAARMTQLEITCEAQKTQISAQNQQTSEVLGEFSASQMLVEKQRAEIEQLRAQIMQRDQRFEAQSQRLESTLKELDGFRAQLKTVRESDTATKDELRALTRRLRLKEAESRPSPPRRQSSVFSIFVGESTSAREQELEGEVAERQRTITQLQNQLGSVERRYERTRKELAEVLKTNAATEARLLQEMHDIRYGLVVGKPAWDD